MAQSVSAVDDAIAHLDSILARLSDSETSAAPATTPAAPVPRTKPAVVSGEPIQRAENVVDIKPKLSEKKSGEPPIPDVLKGRKLKLPGATAANNSPVASGNEQNDHFDKLLFRVQSVENHPISEKLYVCKIDAGGGNIKQVVAGLKKFLTVEELQGKNVCVILNLKTAKLAGQVSEAMILAGSVSIAEGSEIVKILEPPSEAAPGDRIFEEGGAPSPSPAKQLSAKVWEKVVPLLKVEGGLAMFDSKPLVTSTGTIKVPGLPDGATIH